METINWGFIGTGNIASCMAPAVKNTAGAVLYGCAARSLEKAELFAEKWNFQVAYGSYDELLADRKVDVVYIATPHMNHAELSIKAMKAGKAVLCEKPAAVNKAQLQEVLAVSRQTGMFFMEAVWTRFQPAYLETMRMIADGEIGNVQAVYADFCGGVPYVSGSRLYEPELAGGALLDMGIYPLMYASAAAATVQRKPLAKVDINQVHSTCRKTAAGVDAFDTMLIEYAGGDSGELFKAPAESSIAAILTTAIDTGCGDRFKTAKIIGTKATLHIPGFWYAEQINVLDNDGTLVEQKKLPFKVNGYEYEVEEVVRCLREGSSETAEKPVVESPGHTHADSMRLMELMDSFRASWNVIYPFEKPEQLGARKESAIPTIKAGPTLRQNDSAVPKKTDAVRTNSVAADGVAAASCNSGGNSAEPIVVYTDGACSGNPGRGGWGAVILADGKEHPMSGGEKLTTNNRMELMAAIEALEAVLEERTWRSRPVCVVCDSQYVKNGIQTWIKGWKKNGWKTASKDPVKNKDLWIELDEAVLKLNVEWRWVKGHNGNKYNEMCDRLAVEAGQRQ